MPDSIQSTPEPLSPSALIRVEAAALEAVASRLDHNDGLMLDAFYRASGLIRAAVDAGHSVVLAGIGKSGLIARKIAATLVSTGTHAHFLHPAEAVHGDLGLLQSGDILMALSYSGETEELVRLLPILPRIGVGLVALCGSPGSTLATEANVYLDCSVAQEACPHQLAPTASTTAMRALGDALALHVSHARQFKPRDFAELHPGGNLGRRLAPITDLMHRGDTLPSVAPNAAMPAIIHEMSAKRLGMTTVLSGNKLAGVISDGDLRRLFERNGPYAFHKTAAEVMNATPLTIAPTALATDALALMEQRKITALIVTTDGTRNTAVEGVIHMHDLWDVSLPKDKQ
jgi:arabinose-5-phosphate isomerase